MFKRNHMKWISALLICVMMLALCSCGNKAQEPVLEAETADTTENTENAETDDKSEPSQTVQKADEAETVDETKNEPTPESKKEVVEEKVVLGPEEIYAPVLDGYYAELVGEFPIDNYFPMTLGTFEITIGSMDEEALSNVGYAMKDINGDGTQELLIMVVSDRGETSYFGERILAMYTIVQDEVQFLAGGWARDRYFLLNDSRIYNEGSSGADDSSFETYRLIENSDVLEQLDSNDSKSGDYEKQLEEMEKLIEKVEIEPFAEYEISDKYPESAKMFWSAVYVNPAVKTFATIGSDSFKADTSDYARDLVFFTPTEVTGFKFNSLTPVISDDGVLSFTEDELYSLDSLVMDKAVTITMEFAGDTPHYGISYTDVAGNIRRYAICESGFDGSIYLFRY